MTPSEVLQLTVIGLVLAGMLSGMAIARIFRASAWMKRSSTQYLLIAFFTGCLFLGQSTSHRFVYYVATYLMFATLSLGLRTPTKDTKTADKEKTDNKEQ